MEILPEPKGVDDKLREFLKDLMGEDGLTFLDLDNAINAVKQEHRFWQAPFAIGLHALPFLYHWETDSKDTAVPDLVLLGLGLVSQTHSKSGDMTVSDLVGSALEPLEARYASLSAEVSGYRLVDADAHTLFHTRFALGVLLLVKGDEERATTILREMAGTGTTRRGSTRSLGMGLDHWDMEVTKALAAIILQDYYAKRQDYDMALYLLTEAVTSNGPGFFSESLLAVVPGLLESFAEKCERVNSFEEWVDLFDRAAGITEICGEADVSGDLPSKCKVASPQFLAWEFGQLVARFAMRNGLYPGDSKQLLPLLPSGYQDNRTVVDSILRAGGYGNDWGNGTVVASLLCEYDEHRNWQTLRKQYVSMWESSSRYQWLSLCQAGTETDLYWAVRIGFTDKMLEIANQGVHIPAQTEPPPIIRNIEITKDIFSTIAIRQMKLQFDSDKMFELLQKMLERLPPSKEEVPVFLEQQLCSAWHNLPPDVADKLVEAEHIYGISTWTTSATIAFAQAVVACFNYYFVNHFANYMRKERLAEVRLVMGLRDEPIRVGFSRESGVRGLDYLSLQHWAGLFGTLVDPNQKGKINSPIKMFINEKWPKLVLDDLNGLVQPLRKVQIYRNHAVHPPLSWPHKEAKKELEQTRSLALGINGPSVITQIFQLFGAEK